MSDENIKSKHGNSIALKLIHWISNGLSSLFSTENSFVGLSIGTSAIKIIEIKKNGKNFKLVHFGILQLPDEAIVNREIINSISVTESLKTLLAQIKLKNKNICLSLSGASVIVKRMQIEVPNIKDLQEQVFWEAEQYLPFDISDVVMDFQVLSRTKDQKNDVLFVAVKTTALDSYVRCVRDAGLTPKIVDLDFFALQNVVEQNYPALFSEATAVVDIGSSSIKITIVHQGIPVFTKDAVIGGRNLTSEIQKHLNLEFQDAESLKGTPEQEGVPQEVSELIHISCENFASEIKRSIDFYNASSISAPVSSVLLTGGSSKLSILSKIVEDALALPCQILNPFNTITYDSQVFTPEYVQAISPFASIPLGLALRAGAGK